MDFRLGIRCYSGHTAVGMKNTQTFLLGALTGAVIIACGGSSKADGAGGVQTVKLDSGQLSQLTSAVKGADTQWEFKLTGFQELKKWGSEGWQIALAEKDPNGRILYIMTRPKK